MRKNYRSITIPEGLYNAIGEYKKQNKFVSNAEVVRAAIRQFLIKHRS